jgi:iron-sulfur cluster repair protein YtfE (RIC family)
MDVMVDGQQLALDMSAATEFMDVVQIVSSHLGDQGRTIVAITIDGREVSPAELAAEYGERPLADVARLEVESQELATMVRHLLDEMATTLPELPNACRSLAKVFHGDDPESGYEPFQELAAIWNEVKERQRLIVSVLSMAPDDLEIDGTSFEHIHQDLNQYLAEAVEAIEAGDCVSLGDLLEYELAPRAEMESAIVAKLMPYAQKLSD